MLADELSSLERDALTELVNIAVSGAATRLRAMVGSEVRVTVPIVDVLSAVDAGRSLAVFGQESLLVVRQGFAGRLAGDVMLLFNQTDGRTLARAVMGRGYSEADYIALHDDTLGEVGNVLLLGMLSSIGAMLGLTFDVTVPTVEAAHQGRVFPAGGEQVIVLIHVDFSVGQIDARGYFALVLGLGSFAVLREIVSAFILGLMEDEVR